MEACWIDVREYFEFADGHIKGSELFLLGALEKASRDWDRSQPLTLVCRSGRRAEQARQMLAARGFISPEVLGGVLQARMIAGKPLTAAANKHSSSERQVRVTADSLVMAFLGHSLFMSKKFVFGAALVRAGLVYAGVSDNCMMASVLGRMPWNNPR